MYKGTTPSISIIMPESVTVANISELWMTLTQNGTEMLNKVKSNFTISGQRLTVKLTQTETLSFDAEKELMLQVRVLMNDGTAMASQTRRLKVDDVLKGGEITSG